MAKRDYLQRFILIVELLRKKSSSFEDIQDFLADNEIEISQRTFQRDKSEILNLWGIDIIYDKKQALYKIDEQFAEQAYNRIAESFNVVNALKQSNSLSNFIYLENRKSKGTELFHGIIHAIQNNLIVTFQLNSFWNNPTQRRCVPKAIKEAQNRWYLIAYDLNRSEFRNYGLDRISNFMISSSTVTTPSINVEEAYKNAFGIENQGTPTKIVLKIENSQKEYLKSLPLHTSQNITNENKTHFILEVFINQNHDFIMEILKFGSWCEVIEPEELKQRVKSEIEKMINKYNN
jgi:predicted DNA-binding transcriptional regulator YafY